jgi:hypothetical protein
MSDTLDQPFPASAGAVLDRYNIRVLDPFGQPICGMEYYSFAPADEKMNWFTAVLGDENHVSVPIPNKFNGALEFRLEIYKS